MPASAAVLAQVFALACRNEPELRRQAAAFATLLSRQDDAAAPGFVGKTLSRLSDSAFRLACVAADREGLVTLLQRAAAGQKHPHLATGCAEGGRKLLWVFPGHGTGAAAGAGLFRTEPAFRDRMLECDALARELAGWSVVAHLEGGDATRPLGAVGVQVMTFATQVSLASLWREWGIEADGVAGHSMGELAAACVAGALSLHDALRLIVRRSSLLHELHGTGAMAAVSLGADAAEERIRAHGGALVVAAHNSRNATVISGEAPALRQLVALLAEEGIRSTWLADTPGHSPFTQAAADALVAFAHGLVPSAGHVPFYSAVTGGRLPGEALDAAYWGRNLRQAVRFAEVVDGALRDGFTDIVELGAQPILLPGIEEDGRAGGGRRVAGIPSLRRGRDERSTMLLAASHLFVRGSAVRWPAVLAGPAAAAPQAAGSLAPC